MGVAAGWQHSIALSRHGRSGRNYSATAQIQGRRECDSSCSATPHIAHLELFLSERTLIRCRFQRNATALHWAVRKGDVPTITTLIEAGADIQAEDETGQTPWHQAKVGGGDVFAAFPVMSPRGI